jgi:hypothetical protein
MAGQAWPARVEVRYVIENRRRYDGTGSNPHPWQVMWSALAGDPAGEDEDQAGVSEEFARLTAAGFAKVGQGNLEWRLARRTMLAADEILDPEED